jgi:hypothetical protein
MNPHKHRRNGGGRAERMILRAVLVLGLVMAGGLWYLTRGAGEGISVWLPGLVGLTVVGGVNWFGRARARERWEAAWDAYASGDFEFVRFDPVEEEAELRLAGVR